MNRLPSKQVVSQRSRIRNAIKASGSEQRMMDNQRTPSPQKIGQDLPDSVRRDIRLPFIYK